MMTSHTLDYLTDRAPAKVAGCRHELASIRTQLSLI